MLKPWIPFPFLSSFFFLGGSFFTFLFAATWGGFSFASADWFSFSSSMSLWWISAATWLYKSNISVNTTFMKDDSHLDLAITQFHWNLILQQTCHVLNLYRIFKRFYLNGNLSLSQDVASLRPPVWRPLTFSSPACHSSLVTQTFFSFQYLRPYGFNTHYSSKFLLFLGLQPGAFLYITVSQVFFHYWLFLSQFLLTTFPFLKF